MGRVVAADVNLGSLNRPIRACRLSKIEIGGKSSTRTASEFEKCDMTRDFANEEQGPLSESLHSMSLMSLVEGKMSILKWGRSNFVAADY
jgi:hypothetical protein